MNYFGDFSLLLIQLLAIAGVTEVVVEVYKAITKGIFPSSAKTIFFVALGVAMLVATLSEVSLFDKAEVSDGVYWLGALLAGGIASRGANRVHEILDMLKTLKK